MKTSTSPRLKPDAESLPTITVVATPAKPMKTPSHCSLEGTMRMISDTNTAVSIGPVPRIKPAFVPEVIAKPWDRK